MCLDRGDGQRGASCGGVVGMGVAHPRGQAEVGLGQEGREDLRQVVDALCETGVGQAEAVDDDVAEADLVERAPQLGPAGAPELRVGRAERGLAVGGHDQLDLRPRRRGRMQEAARAEGFVVGMGGDDQHPSALGRSGATARRSIASAHSAGGVVTGAVTGRP